MYLKIQRNNLRKEREKYTMITKKRFFDLSKIAVSIPLVAIQRLISPFFLIRVIRLDTWAVGDYIATADYYLSEREREKQEKRWLPKLDFFVFYHPYISSTYLTNLFERSGNFKRKIPFLNYAYRVIQKLPNPHKYTLEVDYNRFMCMTPPRIIEQTAKEKAQGKAYLASKDLHPLEPFVCIHNRDNAYKKDLGEKLALQWDYQKYRDSEISKYIPTIEKLSGLGLPIFRMGKEVADPLNIANPKIFDVDKSRSDMLDFYLIFNCKFFICNNSGLSHVRNLARKPVLLVNFIPFNHEIIKIMGRNSVFLPKKIWVVKDKRYLSFKEMLSLNFYHGDEKKYLAQFDRYGEVLFEENSKKDILEAAMEMNSRIDKNIEDTELNIQMQKKFWSLRCNEQEVNFIVDTCGYRISQHFLESNLDLFSNHV